MIIVSPQTRLDETNFLLWKLQVQTEVRGYGLEEYILGTKQIPEQCISNTERNSVLNREYTIYQRQDSLFC